MAKVKNYTYKRAGKRKELREHYFNKYKQLFFNKFTFKGIENDNALRYMLEQLFVKGSVWISKIRHTEEVYFTDYAMAEYDAYLMPYRVNVIPKVWTSYIPKELQTVNKDGVIIYTTVDRSSPLENIRVLIDKIVDAEMVLDNQLILHKLAWFVFVNPDDKLRMQNVITNLLSDDVAIFGDIEDINSLKTFNSNINYIIDKLKIYINELNNEILTYLGINNVEQEKKEHLITAEVNANNEVIESNNDNFIDSLKDSFSRVFDYLGINISVELKGARMNVYEAQGEEENDDEDIL